jgi:hypothetical protein
LFGGGQGVGWIGFSDTRCPYRMPEMPGREMVFRNPVEPMAIDVPEQKTAEYQCFLPQKVFLQRVILAQRAQSFRG